MSETPLAIRPINFFALEVDLLHITPDQQGKMKNDIKWRLPKTESLLGQVHFAEASMGWNEEGLALYFKVPSPAKYVYYPEFQKGEAIEVFIDTRDVKTTGYNTRFCHHFVFLPEMVNEVQAAEITHFRSDDAHPLCDPYLLQVNCVKEKNAYSLFIWIPQECLYGYDPLHFPKLGFNYRVHSHYHSIQDFAVSSEEFALEQLPSLWASMKLIKLEQ